MKFAKRNINKTNRNGVVNASKPASTTKGKSQFGNYLPAIPNGDGTYTVSVSCVRFLGNVFGEKEITAWKVGNETGGQSGNIIIDTALSPTSENPVQNKVIYTVIGDMSRLTTTAKGSIVDAINEAMLKGGSGADVDLSGYATQLWVRQQGYLTAIPSEYVTETELNDALGQIHTHANKAVLDKISEINYQSWNKVVTDWGKAFYFDAAGNLRVRLNLVGEKEVSAWQVGDNTASVPGLITIVDNLSSTSAEAALSANQGRVLKEMIENKSVNLEGYATQSWVRQQGYLTSYTNNYLTSVYGNGNGMLYFYRNGLEALSVNLGHTHSQYLTAIPSEYVTETELNDALGQIHTHANKAVLDKISEINYQSWNKVVTDWGKAFYFDAAGNLRVRLNLVGEKEVLAWEMSDGTSSIPTPPGMITIVDSLSSTATNCALSANQGRVLKEMIEDKVDTYLPKPLNTNPISFSHPVQNTGNCLFKDDFKCESSGKKWQYALFDFAPLPGETLYARCSRQGGIGNMLRIKALGDNGEFLFEQNTSKNGETLEVFVSENVARLEVAFMLCTSEALPAGTEVAFSEAEVGYVNNEFNNISSVLGICYDNKKIVVDTSRNVISFPNVRWHIESYIEINNQKEYRGYSVFTDAQEIIADPRWGGFIVLDRKTRTLRYLNLPADDSTVLLDKLIVVGTIQKGQGAHFKAPYEEIGTDISRFYESVNPIRLEMQTYRFEQKTIISRIKGDCEIDGVDWDANQSIAVHGNYIFSFQENWGRPNSMAIVFDKTTHEIIGRGTIPQQHPVYNIHCNSAQFSNEYYQTGDEFPLLYLSTYVQGYLYVLRVTRNAGVFNFALVQQITTNEVSAVTYGNSFCANFAKGRLYMYYNENGNYTMTTGNDLIIDEYKLPPVAAGNVTLRKIDKLDSMRFPFVVFQGSAYHRGKIYLGAQGRNEFLPSGNYILVIDFFKGTIDAKIKTIGGEPEGVAIEGNKLYMSYRKTHQSDTNVKIYGISEIKF